MIKKFFMCNLSVTVIARTIDAEKVYELNIKCVSIFILLDNIRSPKYLSGGAQRYVKRGDLSHLPILVNPRPD